MKLDKFESTLASPDLEPTLVECQFEELFLDNPKFNDLAKAMDVFCPFEAVGMDSQEIRHGYFLHYLLSPQRPHGFGPECLRGFMSAAAAAIKDDATTALRPMDVHLMNLDSAIIEREYSANVDGKPRLIDILIKIPAEKLVITVELKIDAAEHSGQLRDYRKFISQEFASWDKLFLFVTKRDDAPSIDDGEGWHNLSLETIANTLERIVARGSGHVDARTMTQAYVSMLRRKHLTDKRLEKIAKDLWLEHEEVLDYLMKRRPNVEAKIFDLLLTNRENVAQKLSDATGFEIVTDYSTGSVARFAVRSWDAFYGVREGTGWSQSPRIILFEIMRYKGKINCNFTICVGEKDSRKLILEALKNHQIIPEIKEHQEWIKPRTDSLFVSKDFSSKAVEIDTIYEEIVIKAAEFLKKHIDQFDQAIKTLPLK